MDATDTKSVEDTAPSCSLLPYDGGGCWTKGMKCKSDLPCCYGCDPETCECL